jgi:hypothetical protein
VAGGTQDQFGGSPLAVLGRASYPWPVSLADSARRLGLYDLLEPAYSVWRRHKWERRGRPTPPPSAVKRELLSEYASRFGLRVLVETGTYKADTVRALRGQFHEIHSIEIDERLYANAQRRCRRQPNARLHLGNSAEILPQIMAELREPALFWLDAHYSGRSTGGIGGHPLLDELDTCLRVSAGHVVLVDDVREFGASEGYPTIESVIQLAASRGYGFQTANDVARLVPMKG